MGDFEEFRRPAAGKKQAHEEPMATLYYGGALALNAAAHAALGHPKRVILLADPSGRRLALRAARGDEPHAANAIVRANQRTARVALRAFCTHYGIEPTLAPVYLPATLAGGLLILDARDATWVG